MSRDARLKRDRGALRAETRRLVREINAERRAILAKVNSDFDEEVAVIKAMERATPYWDGSETLH